MKRKMTRDWATKAIRSAGRAVRDGVTLEVFNHEIRAADVPTSLSLDSKDDRIVHSVKKYLEEHAGARVAVYTEDMGMSLRCEANGVAVAEPDPQRRLENPQDELTKKYRQAVSELNAIKNRLPSLTLQVANGGRPPQEGRPFTIELAPKWQPHDVPAELLKVHQAHPKHSQASSLHRTGLPSMMFEKTVSSDDWKRYNSQLDYFYMMYEAYFGQLDAWGECSDRIFNFDLFLTNSGNCPAEDMDVFLILPPPLKLVARVGSEQAKAFMRPVPPAPPERPKPRPLLPESYHADFPAVRPIAAQIAEAIANRDRDTVEVQNNGNRGFCIHAKIRRLKHGEQHRIGTFLAFIASWDDVKPFEAEFTISAAELPTKATGKIPIVIKVAKKE
jgi:hypothetical protein